jgi:hypothetical protein
MIGSDDVSVFLGTCKPNSPSFMRGLTTICPCNSQYLVQLDHDPRHTDVYFLFDRSLFAQIPSSLAKVCNEARVCCLLSTFDVFPHNGKD